MLQIETNKLGPTKHLFSLHLLQIKTNGNRPSEHLNL